MIKQVRRFHRSKVDPSTGSNESVRTNLNYVQLRECRSGGLSVRLEDARAGNATVAQSAARTLRICSAAPNAPVSSPVGLCPALNDTRRETVFVEPHHPSTRMDSVSRPYHSSMTTMMMPYDLASTRQAALTDMDRLQQGRE